MRRCFLRNSLLCKAAALGCLLMIVFGCSGRRADRWTRMRPTTYPVRVHVVWNGEPTEDVLVVFESADRAAMAVGRTDARGVCQLKTFDPGDGAVAGEHRVRIEKIIVTGTAGDGRILDASIMPKTYADPGTSGLTASVVATGNNDFTFEVSGPARMP